MIYLAGAYSQNPGLAYRLHLSVSREFVRAGLMVYSPIVYGHTVAPSAPYHYWITHGLGMLPKCGRIHVLDTPELQSQASRGVKVELEQALLHELTYTQQYIANAERYIASCDVSVWP